MKETYESRPADLSDIEWLYELRRSVYRDVVLDQFGSWEEDRQREMFEDGLDISATEILLIEGEPCGMLHVAEAPDHLSLVEIQVSPLRQGSGIGSAVVRALIARSGKLGTPLRLTVLLRNVRARAFYERLGFRKVGSTETHDVMELGSDRSE